MSQENTSRPVITVISGVRHPRLRYALRIVGDDLGYRFRLNSGEAPGFAERNSLGTISYGKADGHGLPHHPFLAGKDVAPADTAVKIEEGLPVFFDTPGGPDLLACIFFALSRYEEYQAHATDAHGRFTAGASHALRHGYLERPIVREWTAALGRRLRQWIPNLPPPRKQEFAFQPTYDIDLPWAYHHRGWRGGLSMLRDVATGKGARAVARLKSTPASDPYATTPALEALHRRHDLRATYFWLLSDNSDRRDPNPYPIPAAQSTLIRQLATSADTGIHPGYLSSDQPQNIAAEKERLEEIVGHPVKRSRQHFLRFRLPATYRQLLEAGIEHDYSMGYSDRAGWRAGTNLPFPWYDLDRERLTGLTLHPFAAMDVTLKNYMSLSGADAGAKILELANSVRPFAGPFPLLWHNSSFATDYGWEGWWEHYESLVGELTRDRKDPSHPDSEPR